VNRNLNGVYYVASQHAECSPWYILDGKLDRLVKGVPRLSNAKPGNAAVNTGTAARLPLHDASIDYIFTDPPFGENIYYADLNFLVEAWHGVMTDAKPEAIVDAFKKKALPEYQHLMQRCFKEYYRVLKPGRWMTVVFSNSKAAVWNAIPSRVAAGGLRGGRGHCARQGARQLPASHLRHAVKQDLVISAYKPNGGLEDRFATRADRRLGVGLCADPLEAAASRQGHGASAELEFIVERDPRRIYDRMVSWFIRHGVMVPLSTPEFLAEPAQPLPRRDGMVFLPEQVVEYDKKRAQIPQARRWSCSCPMSAVPSTGWQLLLKRKPSTYQEIHPEYIPQIGRGWKKQGRRSSRSWTAAGSQLPAYDGTGEVPSQIHSYLSTNHNDLRGLDKSDPRLVAKAQDRWYVPDPNKAQDLEKKREKALLKEFETYKAFTGRKIKESRLEVLRAGFRSAWANKDYATIISRRQQAARGNAARRRRSCWRSPCMTWR
jgi:predicted RNA methylase